MLPKIPLRRFLPFATALLFGCSGGNWSPQQRAAWQQQYDLQQQHLARLQEMERRAGGLDADNQDLHRQLAQSQQQVVAMRDEMQLMRQQLADTTDQLAKVRVEKQEVAKKVAALQASIRHRGGAIITANNSLTQQLRGIDLEGANVRVDGDVVRIELPADQLFLPDTASLKPEALSLIDRAADAVRRNYPRQMIGIEGHTDNRPSAVPGMSGHQLSITQALAVFTQLTNRHHFPPNQLFILGHGPAKPIVSNGTPTGQARNRRVELVVYPETAT